MATISIKHDYTMAADHLAEELKNLAEKMGATYQLVCEWPDDHHLRFSRRGANGEIIIKSDHVSVEIKLGLVLSPLKTKLEKDIRHFLQKHIQ